MMARRPLNVFALSFLDCMCCGFGAVILVFMIISAKIQDESEQKLEGFQIDRVSLENQVLDAERLLAQLRSAFDKAVEQRAVASHMRDRLDHELRATGRELEAQEAQQARAEADLEAQKKLIAALESSKTDVAEMADLTGSVRTIHGEGNRQYLTGLRMSGRRMLVLVDSSASMLASTLVNVIRLRYVADAQKLRSEKWQQAVGTVDWLTANFPKDSSFQIYTFNTQATPVLHERGSAWIPVSDGAALDEAVRRLRKTVPAHGTSLHAAFSVIGQLTPRPDNVYLLTDGLPTQGSGPPSSRKVSGNQRLKNFESALRRLPRGVPVNVILYAMEGDPYAAKSFWELARSTRGSFLSPSVDWP
jgi:hypothetical protein